MVNIRYIKFVFFSFCLLLLLPTRIMASDDYAMELGENIYNSIVSGERYYSELETAEKKLFRDFLFSSKSISLDKTQAIAYAKNNLGLFLVPGSEDAEKELV